MYGIEYFPGYQCCTCTDECKISATSAVPSLISNSDPVLLAAIQPMPAHCFLHVWQMIQYESHHDFFLSFSIFFSSHHSNLNSPKIYFQNFCLLQSDLLSLDCNLWFASSCKFHVFPIMKAWNSLSVNCPNNFEPLKMGGLCISL